ncbi:unnamed protein product [Rotaria magnacalcarata]|uniref:Uncharacterized protein n=1 Tax=Rotaria magnacalcarata TaxID=392030 RepID=A0A815MRK4_9BILA|nr:unnamed protein product [Rotaria magnacalcarata]CAF1428486.1 unnamed protein product [Rotaria magnacalcarata]CAF2139324.1 unnamed protein product [Rotaria magnacalcarata]
MALEVTRFWLKEVCINRWYIFPFIAYSIFVHKHENLRQDYFRNRSQLVGGMKTPNWSKRFNLAIVYLLMIQCTS